MDRFVRHCYDQARSLANMASLTSLSDKPLAFCNGHMHGGFVLTGGATSCRLETMQDCNNNSKHVAACELAASATVAA